MVDVAQLEAKCTQQGGVVRELKKAKAPKAEITAAVATLKAFKDELAEFEKTQPKTWRQLFPQEKFSRMCKETCIFLPSFDIYGGTAGLYDMGPPACGVKQAMLNHWRQHFVLEESMLEIDTVSVTPKQVLQVSGHVDRFNDVMVRDVKEPTQCFRADKVLEEHVENVMMKATQDPAKLKELDMLFNSFDGMSCAELDEQITKLGVKAPDTGNDLSPSFPFNLMFETKIGPTGTLVGYMRPELAQGMMTNFRHLLGFNAQKMPFAAATVGQAFRNEIAPRSGLIRVREFTLAEIEHFMKFEDDSHPKIGRVADVSVPFMSAESQKTGTPPAFLSIQSAMDQGIIKGETHAYFIGRVMQFLTNIGIHSDKLRFRQHKSNELAHYCDDCWDAEIETSYGWVECVGIANRASFDLKVHTEATKVELMAGHVYDTPKDVTSVTLTKKAAGLIGKTYKGDAKKISPVIEAMTADQKRALGEAAKASGSAKVSVDGEEFELTKDCLVFEEKKTKEHGCNYYPSVIEPSFGIGRILYAMLEHAYYVRPDDDKANVLALKPLVAPIKVTLVPVVVKAQFMTVVDEISSFMAPAGIAYKVDSSGVAIGRKYARADQLGVPFGITVDGQTEEDRTVTVRERDTTAQIRVPISEVTDVIKRLCLEHTTWAECCTIYPDMDGKIAAPAAGAAAAAPKAAASAPASSAAAASGPAASQCAALNDQLSKTSYLSGWVAGGDDFTTLDSFSGANDAVDAATYPNLARWYAHVRTLKRPAGSAPAPKKKAAPAPAKAAAPPAAAKAEKPKKAEKKKEETKKAAPAPAPAADEDDEFDLFGSDDEDDAELEARVKAAQEKIDAKNQVKGKVLIAKSALTLDVKPWEADTPMAKLEACVRTITMEGLLWGKSKLVDVAFGVKKLQINAVIEDEKVSTDDLQDQIEAFEDYVQSMDVVAFQKI